MAEALSLIGKTAVAQDRFDLWGVTVNDYVLNGTRMDFETLMVEVSTSRATTIESQVKPISDQVTVRNKRLSRLGANLAELTNYQVAFPSDAQGTDKSSAISDELYNLLVEMGGKWAWINDNNHSEGRCVTKAMCESNIQLVKTEMDKLNNDAQADMTRLQSLVSKRDESFTSASSIMQSISDTRTNALKAMGG